MTSREFLYHRLCWQLGGNFPPRYEVEAAVHIGPPFSFQLIRSARLN